MGDLSAWTRSGRVTYHPRWPARLSMTLASMSHTFPGCTETWAYAHCIATQRALSRWVLILHSPDEYVVLGNRTGGSLLSLLPFIEELAHDLPSIEGQGKVAAVNINQIAFARGGPQSAEVDIAGRGSVLGSSQLRGDTYAPFTALVDPQLCGCAGPHKCHAAEGGRDEFSFMTMNSAFLRTHHYVEMQQRHRGRCRNSLGNPCDVPDMSVSWAIQQLQRYSGKEQ